MPEGNSSSSSSVRLLFKRPESVLVVIYTLELDVLLICRQSPVGFWQSVTGSIEHGENPREAAQRELFEETGISQEVVDHRVQRVFPIRPAWQKRYAPGVSENLEHEFSVQLPVRCSVTLDPDEHSDYQWLPLIDAIAKVSSRSNRSALQSILKVEG
jgi:dATP pyrophosphohydrolase